MKPLPGVIIWYERIDGDMFALHCVRKWDLPSNGVFLLVHPGELATWDGRQAAFRTIERKLELREKRLAMWHGRRWRHHMTEYNFDGCTDIQF